MVMFELKGEMSKPCPDCGTRVLPVSIDVIKNSYRDHVVRICGNEGCGRVFERELCDAASGKKYPSHIRNRECHKPEDKSCPMDNGAPGCEDGDGGILYFRCGYYKMEPLKRVVGGSICEVEKG